MAPFGAPLFTLVGTGNDGTLFLPRDQRVVEHGPPAEVMAAVAGVPLGANDMLRTLTGCAMPDRLDSPLAIGDNWRTSAGPGGAKIYMHRDSATAPWRLVTYLMAATRSVGAGAPTTTTSKTVCLTSSVWSAPTSGASSWSSNCRSSSPTSS